MELRSSDGIDVRFAQEGNGPVILIVHGGLSDESPWAKVAHHLASDYTVVRIRRRLYRTDIPAEPVTSIAREVDDITALTDTFDAPGLIVGHSSGAIIALEALVQNPKAFSAAVLYEPPVVLSGQIGKPDTVARARAAQASGHLGRALSIFLSESVQIPRPLARLAGVMTRFHPDLRQFGPRQIDDNDALDRLGRRIEAYAKIPTPTLFLVGTRSPAHLGERTRVLAAAMPNASIEVLTGQGHRGHLRAPRRLAQLIARQCQTTSGTPASMPAT